MRLQFNSVSAIFLVLIILGRMSMAAFVIILFLCWVLFRIGKGLHSLFSGTSQRIMHVRYCKDLTAVDVLDGINFEYWCADLLKHNGFTHIHVTPASGDHGVDILAMKKGKKYAIQCKRYSSNLSISPIEEVASGRDFYGCTYAVVMTNSYFTEGAVKAARSAGVQLWDRNTILQMLNHKRKHVQQSTPMRIDSSNTIVPSSVITHSYAQTPSNQSVPAYVYCHQCGKKLLKGSRFCSNCGCLQSPNNQ